MSDPIESIEAGTSQKTTTQPAEFPDVSSTSTTTSGTEVSGVTRVNSMDELRTKAPEVYNKMMEGIANRIINEMRRRQERIKQLMREGRRNAGQ